VRVDFSFSAGAVTPMDDPALEAVRSGIPAARALPLLQILARGAGDAPIEYLDGAHLVARIAA
jgi:hypothetical protein